MSVHSLYYLPKLQIDTNFSKRLNFFETFNEQTNWDYRIFVFNIIYILNKHHETPYGFENHLEANSNFAYIGDMQQLVYEFSVPSAFGNKIFAMTR